MEKFLQDNNIKQLYISISLDINNTPLKNINIKNYSSNEENTLFFGMYFRTDYEIVNKHKGKKWILWGGNDADVTNIERLKLMKNITNIEKHIALTDKIFKDLEPLFKDNLIEFSNLEDLKKHNFDIKIMNNNNENNNYKLIFYDPKYKKNFGHFDIFLSNLKEVYNDNIIHLTNLEEDLEKNQKFIFFCYIYNNSIFESKFKNYILKNLNKDTLLIFNLWFKEDTNKILALKESFKNYKLHIITDGDIKQLNTNLYINNIYPPLINYKDNKVTNYNKKNDYYLTFTWNQNIFNNDRWLNFSTFVELSNKLDKKLKIIYNDPSLKNLKEYPNIINISRFSNNDNEFLDLCRYAKCVFILNNKNYYNFRSSKKIIDLIYHNIPFLCNFNHFHFNNTNYYIDIDNITIKAIETKINNQPKIDIKNYYNLNFKKNISIFNISNLLSKKKIDILGNGPELKNYNWNNNNIKLGLNVAYRYWIKNDIYPDIYVSLDPVVTEYHASNIFDLIKSKKIKYFFLNSIFFEKYKETLFLENVFNFDLLKVFKLINFSPDITTGIFAVKLSIIMGFKDISIYGMNNNNINYLPECEIIKNDLNGVKVLKIIKDVNNNPNYFFNYYQQKGDLYQIPNANKEFIHKYLFDILEYELKSFNIKYKLTHDVHIKKLILY